MSRFRLPDIELKVWLRKGVTEDREPITSIYLDEDCIQYFGYYDNRLAKSENFPHVSRKDVQVSSFRKGVVPVTLVFKAGHE